MERRIALIGLILGLLAAPAVAQQHVVAYSLTPSHCDLACEGGITLDYAARAGSHGVYVTATLRDEIGYGFERVTPGFGYELVPFDGLIRPLLRTGYRHDFVARHVAAFGVEAGGDIGVRVLVERELHNRWTAASGVLAHVGAYLSW